MYKKVKKQLKAFLRSVDTGGEQFSRSTMNTIIRALLEPVAGQNAVSLVFTRLKNKDGLDGLIKRLEYCNNVEMVDVTVPDVLIKDDYVELEFIVFTSARYNFALIWDYSSDANKNYTGCYFIANSRAVNDVYEILQSNMYTNYREKFYLHKPERRENELLNEALFNILKKLNASIEENPYSENDALVVDLSSEDNYEGRIKEIAHEIKNKLSVMDVHLAIIEKKNGKNNSFDVIRKSISDIFSKLNELKNFDELDIKEIVLQDIIEELILTLKDVVFENGNKIAFENKHKYDIRIFADENKLLSALINIIKNADESTQNDEIKIEIEPVKDSVVIDITNHGTPIDPKNQALIFNSGFTTKNQGWGIGLFSSRNYIEDMNGSLVLLKSDSEGTTFRIELPSGQ